MYGTVVHSVAFSAKILSFTWTLSYKIMGQVGSTKGYVTHSLVSVKVYPFSYVPSYKMHPFVDLSG